MRKVLRIIARLNIGGPAIHAILLSSALSDASYKNILVCGSVGESEGDMIYLAEDHCVKPMVIPELGREISFTKDLRAFFKLYSIMRRERPDIVHTHTAKAGALGRLAAIFAGVPVRIHTFHGHIFDGYFSPFKAALFIFIERCLAGFTNKVIVVSEGVREELVDKLKVVSPDRCVVVRLGLELREFLNNESMKRSFRKKIDVGEDVLLVGIIGRLVPIKNHRMFLDIARKVKDDAPDLRVKFLIIGDGESRKYLEDYSKKLGLCGSVFFTGWVNSLPEVYADLDVVALTSLNEGTPVSLIEAMASARPVVSTAVGGVKDIVFNDENGLLVKSMDVDDFSCKLLLLLRDREKRMRMGLRGREFVKDRHCKDRLVRDIRDLYDSCLKEA